MNDLEITMANHDQIIKIIGKAIKEKKYDIACEILMIVNDLRMENHLEPLTPSDVLFMNFTSLFDEKPAKDEKKCLYIFQLSDKTVKIGVSKNPQQRINTLSKQSGKKVINQWISNLLINAFKIEKELHEFFSSKRLEGEYFQINFNEAVIMAQKAVGT